MVITTAHELQSKFKAGIQIVGENYEGQLEWIGSPQQWRDSQELDYRNFEEVKSYNPDQL